MSIQGATPDKTPRVFKGSTINAGRVAAQVCLFSAGRQKLIPEYTLAEDELTSELGRFQSARAQCSEELGQVAKEVETSIGKAEAEIFTTQRHILNDPKVVDAVALIITAERKNAEWAISRVLTEFEEKMASLDNQYLRERSSDLGELRRRLLNLLTDERAGFLCEGQIHCRRGEHRVIVAEELTPNMIVNMKMNKVMGFVTEHGGITSHAAILARSLGVPAVSGVSGFMQHVACGDTVLINGDTGEVHLHPDKTTLAALIQVMPEEKTPAMVVLTPSGMELVANASSLEDVNQARSMNADGIGLFRTEILFVGADRLLSEDEQYVYYRDVVDAMGGKPVTIRMLDIGGDKPLPFLRLKKEANPFLGWRGARFLLGNHDIFNGQIRALGRLSKQKKIRVLFPMVIDAAQMQALLDRARDALSGVEHDSGNITYGAMFEVPSAFLQAREIMKKIGFSSIGSNDLIQYLFAMDRDNEMVSQDYNPDHPALWIFLRELSAVARELNKPLSICGEMAGREGMPEKLLDAKISSLSVAPRLIPRVRNEMIRYARSKKHE
jgi:phosphoenolpyruvate-protein phosphotransferase (PTS system enzyme I)